MKIIFTLSVLLVNWSGSNAQQKMFYNSANEPTDSASSLYYVRLEELTTYKFSTYIYTKTNTQFYRAPSKQNDEVLDFVMYYPTKKVWVQGKSRNNFPVGEVKTYYDNGSAQGVFYHRLSYEDSFETKILEYSDSLGTKTVSNGNGHCDCNIIVHYPTFRLQRGLVRDGLQEGEWEIYDNNRVLIYRQTYLKGVFVKGRRMIDGKEVTYDKIEVPAEYKGGTESMVKYIARNLKYPKDARKQGIQGTVDVSFVIDTDGKVTDTKVIKGIGGGCDEEAVRVISILPPWIPATQRGVPVRMRYTFPLKFRL